MKHLPKQVLAAIILLFCLHHTMFGQGASYSNTITYSANGTFRAPAGNSVIGVDLVGGGGGCYDDPNCPACDKSGGGGGAYATHTSFPLINVQYNVIVGMGGTRGNAGTASRFNPSTAYTSNQFIEAGGGAEGQSLGSFGLTGPDNFGEPDGLYSYGRNGGAGGGSYSEITLFSGGGGGGQAGSSAGNGAFGSNNGTFGTPGNGGGPAGYPGSGGKGGADGHDGVNGNYPGGGAGGDGSNAPRAANTAQGANGYVKIYYNCPTYSLLSVVIPSENCTNTGITVTLNSTAASLPVGEYRMTYSISGANIVNNQVAILNVTQAGSASFAIYLSTSGTNVLTITKLESGTGQGSGFLCQSLITANNVSNSFTVNPSIGAVVINQPLYSGCSGDSIPLFVQNVAQGKAMHVDGIASAYIEDNSMTLSPASGFTIEGWIKANATGNYAMASRCIGAVPAPFDVYVITTRSVVFRVGNGSSVTSLSTANNVISNAGWFHVACVYNPSGSGSLSIYVNGQLKATLNTIAPSAVANAAGSNFRMGNRADLTMPLYGNLDEIRIWNVARTSSQIATNMSIPVASNATALVGYYKFDEGGGNFTRNSVTNNLSAQLHYANNFDLYFINSDSPVGTPFGNYLWSPGGATTPQINASTTGTYTVTVSDGNNCTGSSSVYITVNPSPSPEIIANGPTSFCSGGSVQLSTLSSALWFDGADDYVEDNSLTLNPALGFTIEGWMKLQDINSNPLNGLASRTLNNIAAPFDCYADGTQFKFFIGNGTTWTNVNTPVMTILGGIFRHVACVYSPVTTPNLRIYIDGELKASANTSYAPANAGGTTFRLGNRSDNVTAMLGHLDEVRIWNSVRSVEQIVSSMNTTVPSNSAGLAGYYKLNEGAGTTTKNSVTGLSSGVLTNGPVWFVVSGSPLGFSGYTWSPGGAASSSITANTQGVYTVTVSNTYGCTASATQAVTVFNNKPVIVADGPTSFCEGDSVTLSTTQAFATYSWSPGGATSPTRKVMAGGTYILSVTDLNGCGGINLKDTQIVVVSPKPSISLSATPNKVCTGSSTNLSASLTYPVNMLSPLGDSIIFVNGNNASPFPRSVDVTNLPAANVILKAVYLNDVTNTSAKDIDIWLQSPGGQNIILMSDVGGLNALSNKDLIITDSLGVPNFPSTALTLTYYKPTNLEGVVAPEPAGALTQLNAFTGDLNGTWKLFVRDDDNAGGASQYIGSFRLEFVTSPPANTWSASPAVAASGIVSPGSVNTTAVVNENAQYIFTSDLAGCASTSTLTVTALLKPSPVIGAAGTTNLCAGQSVALNCPTIGTTCLNFTATGQHVAIPYDPSLDPTSSLSLEAWIKPTNVSGVKYIIARGNNDLAAGFYGLYLIDDKLRFSISGNASSMASNTAIQPNVWTHVAGTWNGTTMKLYINGVLDKTKSQAAPKPANTANLRIGWLGAANPYQYQFTGMIDEVRLWNTERTQAQLVANMNAYLPATNTGLIAYFKLNEGSGTTTANAVAGMASGTLSGGPAWVMNASAGYAALTWSPGAATSPTITVNTSNTYSVTVTDVNGCAATATRTVTVNPLPTAKITAGGPTTFCNGDSVRLITNVGGNAIQFNGTNRLVGPNGVVPVLGDYTVEVWAKQQGALGSFANIFAQGRNLYLGKSNTGIIRLGDAWSNTGVMFPTDMNWHHYAIVRTSVNTFLYLDGQLVATKGSAIPSPGVNATWPYNLIIGAQWTASLSEAFNGFVDEMQIWNTARSAAQIQEDRLSVYPSVTPGLVAMYSFDEGTGNTAVNSVTSAEVLTFENNPVWSVPSTSPLGGMPVANFSWSTGSGDYDTKAYASGMVRVEVASNFGCTAKDSILITTTPCNLTLNLKAYLQGYYVSGGNMTNTLMNQGVGNSAVLCDSVTVELHSMNAPYATMFTYTNVMQTSGQMICTFPPAALGNDYYVVMRHRNTVETWSADPVRIALNTTYDFTNAASKAYGNNQVEVEPGIYALYTGDLNTDENIDLLDGTLLETDINLFAFGYLASDLNGDGNVDLLDNPVLEANINQFIFAIHP